MTALHENASRPAAHWVSAASRLKGGPRLLALARAVGRGSDPATLTAALGEEAAELGAAKQKTLTSELDARLEYGRRGSLSDAAALGIIGDGLLAGADPSYLLRAAARVLDTNGQSTAALDFIQAALAIAPRCREWYRDTLALVLINQARFEEAAAEAKKVAKVDAAQGRWLKAYVEALRQPLNTFWLQAYVDEGVSEDAKPSERTLTQGKRQLSLVAGRVEALVKALRKAMGDRLELPVVTSFKPVSDDFDADEYPGVADKLLKLRIEWHRLCWLITVLGGTALEPLTKIEPPPDPLSYLETIATVRFNLLLDYADGKKPKAQDQLDRDAMVLTWGGVPMPKLAPHLAKYWADEVAAILAVVRWATQEHDSVFVDP